MSRVRDYETAGALVLYPLHQIYLVQNVFCHISFFKFHDYRRDCGTTGAGD